MNIEPSTNLEPNPIWKGQWLGYICLAMLVFFTWLPNSYYLMVSYPWIVIWQVGFLCLGIWAIWMLRQFKIPFKPLGYGLDWIVGLGVITLILSGIFAQFKQVAAWNISLVLCYVCLLYVLRNWIGNSFLTIERLWKGICISGIISCIIGLIVWYPEFIAGRPRILYPMGHPNFVAGYILLVLPLTLALAVANKGWQRIASFAASFLMGLVLYYTGSRGGLLGIFVLTVTATAFFIVRSVAKKQWLQVGTGLLALIIVASIIFNNPRVQKIVKISTPNSDASVVRLQVDGESQDRLFMLQAAFKIFKHHPLLGIGVGNMSRVYDLYRPVETGTGGNHIQQLHNTPLQILGELGLAGLSVYFLFIGWLVYFWCKLYYVLSKSRYIWLLYGIGGSFLSYIISSLTDYQLENIPISTTLCTLVAVLIKLANNSNLIKNNDLGNYSRRLLSLGIIAILFSILILWLPVARAMQLTAAAQTQFANGKLDRGYQKLLVAESLVPWDPTYSLLAGLNTLKIREPVRDLKLFQELTEMSFKHFQKVVKSAPNDAPFNQMLGMLERDLKNKKQAIFYFNRSIRLFPRNASYNYYLLGREYLEEQQIEPAITAFALQGLIIPKFLTSGVWEQPLFASIKEPVFQKSLDLFSILLEQLSPTDPNYDLVYENIVLLRWWQHQALNNIDLNRLRPIVKAIILAEPNPELSLQVIDNNIESSINPTPFLLLGSWLKPQEYFKTYLATEAASQLEDTEREELINITEQQQPLRFWLTTLRRKLKSLDRNALVLTYRNQYMQQGSYLILPEEVILYSLIQKMNLFSEYPREFKELELLIDKLIEKDLNIKHIAI